MPAEPWCQLNIVFEGRDAASRVIADSLGPALVTAESSGFLRAWWYMNKQPWPLRYLPTGPGVAMIGELLDQLAADGAIVAWAPGIYEPETLAFGGDDAMDAAHALFHQDSRNLVIYGPPAAAGHLGRRETTVLLCSSMMRAASLDLFEQADVWAKVAALRPAAAQVAPCRAAELVNAMRQLMACDTRQLCDRTGNGPLVGHETWVHAFEQAGQTLARLAHRGELTRGLRKVLAHHVIFHANRAGLCLEDQTELSALATEVVMGTGCKSASESGVLSGSVRPVMTGDGRSGRDEVATRLRHKLVDEIVSSGLARAPGVDEALRTVPRHRFVPGASLEDAYANSTVSIKQDGDGISISCASQPAVVAVMLDQLQPQPGDRVLEIGAGTGYNAALLACLTGPDGHVTTIDVDEDLVLAARTHLDEAAVPNVSVVLGDGALGYAADAPYDRIVATVGAHGIPPVDGPARARREATCAPAPARQCVPLHRLRATGRYLAQRRQRDEYLYAAEARHRRRSTAHDSADLHRIGAAANQQRAERG